MAEPLRVGLPRALLYYWFAAAWETFLSVLGARPVTSPPTNKALLNLGQQAALDEVCLPVKLFLGHAAYLGSRCDALFVPHLISLEGRAFTCPKFMGLPDLVRQALPDQRTITVRIDVRAGLIWSAAARDMAGALGCWGRRVEEAWRQAGAAQAAYERALCAAYDEAGDDRPLLAVLGHPYCLYDRFLNMNLLERLSASGCRVVTPEMVPAADVDEGLAALPKNLFWTFGRRQIGAINHLLAARRCRGVVHATAFACGPEALVGEMIEHAAARHRVPLLRLNLDEHTGEAGFLTRLEAFLDMMGRRSG